jgi:hypothetical protein
MPFGLFVGRRILTSALHSQGTEFRMYVNMTGPLASLMVKSTGDRQPEIDQLAPRSSPARARKCRTVATATGASPRTPPSSQRLRPLPRAQLRVMTQAMDPAGRARPRDDAAQKTNPSLWRASTKPGDLDRAPSATRSPALGNTLKASVLWVNCARQPLTHVGDRRD